MKAKLASVLLLAAVPLACPVQASDPFLSFTEVRVEALAVGDELPSEELQDGEFQYPINLTADQWQYASKVRLLSNADQFKFTIASSHSGFVPVPEYLPASPERLLEEPPEVEASDGSLFSYQEHEEIEVDQVDAAPAEMTEAEEPSPKKSFSVKQYPYCYKLTLDDSLKPFFKIQLESEIDAEVEEAEEELVTESTNENSVADIEPAQEDSPAVSELSCEKLNAEPLIIRVSRICPDLDIQESVDANDEEEPSCERPYELPLTVWLKPESSALEGAEEVHYYDQLSFSIMADEPEVVEEAATQE